MLRGDTMKLNKPILLLVSFLIILGGCNTSTEPTRSDDDDTEEPISYSPVEHPEWANNATIYEVNIRQYSQEGTFDAFTEDIPRLKEMGVEVLWLMPIHPIGEENRLGELGSYYSVQDFGEVNPEFGSKEDLRELVQTAHNNDMKVILDWVANHTAWDHVWTESNPDWYTKDENGNFVTPQDWSDVIELNYNIEDMRDEMVDEMSYWVEEFNIDGFRADFASGVPMDFWNRVRHDLNEIKPTFLLAEAEEPEFHEHAFDMSYAWSFPNLTHQIADGNAGPNAIHTYMLNEQDQFDNSDYRMYYTSNHDINSWENSAVDRYGPALETMAVLASTLNGMPLVYNGQEARIDEELAFFQKDQIEWSGYELEEFYTKLLQLNQNNPALWNGEAGGNYERISTNNSNIFAFRRVKEENEVLVLLNLSDQSQTVTLQDIESTTYTDIFAESEFTINSDPIELSSWDYLVLEK
ncbi:alpha-amylase family glycosyl hydrolase [Aliifodinibius salipaludis]|nr:alpha-amylase family glycosyl hydrolase [Aliifodinibius salipaludis]